MSAARWILSPRTGEKGETGFIFSAWLAGARQWCPDKFPPKETFDWYQHKVIEHFMDAPSTVWIVATHADDPATYFGFLCGQVFSTGPVLHWVHVKKNLQRYGIGSAMVGELRRRCPQSVRDAPLTVTSTTHHWQRATPLSCTSLYNPWCLYTACLPQGWHLPRRGQTDATSTRA